MSRLRALAWLALPAALLARPARADEPAPEAAEAESDGSESVVSEPMAPEGYTPPPGAVPALSLNGYVDIGFAHAHGDGTSFSPDDTRVPLDYGSDPFQPMVNSRGDVASTDSGGRFVNHFLPPTVGIGSKPSFLINTVSADVRFAPESLPLLIFVRAQALPRFYESGPSTQVLVEQAFAKVNPFARHEFQITVGKFDPVFGIEYLENEANLRTNITPSLIARYTTGQQLGVKALYRRQFPALRSSLSLNVAATNNSSEIEALQPSEISLTGYPVVSARLGYELGLPWFDIKLGASGLYGPRNDQRDPGVTQAAWGADARLVWGGLSLAGEFISLDQQPGTEAEKLTGTGPGVFATEFYVRGFYAEATYGLRTGWETLQRVSPYFIYSRRHAWFDGFTPVMEDRFTGGVRVDVWESLAVKAEVLFNRELKGAPEVPNDVETASVVYSW